MLKKIIEIIAQVLLIPLIQKWVEQYRLRKQIEKEQSEIDKQHARKHDEFKDNRTKDNFNNLP